MLVPQKVNIKLNPRNSKRLKALGYTGKLHEVIEIDVNHLSKGSTIKVYVKCDYCKKEIFQRDYYSHINSAKKDYLGDCCEKCFHLKRSKITLNATRIKYDFVKSEFEKRGYKLITKYYGSQAVSNIKLEFLCEKHLEYGSQFIRWNKFYTKNQGCRYCAEENRPRLEGGRNPSWKGGVSDINNRERHSRQYKQWVKNIYERDNYTCQICDQKGGELRAHHIISFARNKELRYELSNGITLCKHCHDVDIKGSFHNTYGTVNCTKEQLVTFILKKTSESKSSL